MSRTVSLLGQPTRPDGQHALQRFRCKHSLTFSCSAPEESAVKGCALAYALKIRVDTHSLWLIRMPHRLVLLRVETAICGANNSFAMLKLLENPKIALRRLWRVRQSLQRADGQLPQFQQAPVPTEGFGKELFLKVPPRSDLPRLCKVFSVWFRLGWTAKIYTRQAGVFYG